MPYLHCDIKILSDKCLEEVAATVSSKLLGGVSFVGRAEYIHDEVPAVFAEHDILGLRVILQGCGGAQGYFLEMRGRKPLDSKSSPEDIEKSVVDISNDVEIVANF